MRVFIVAALVIIAAFIIQNFYSEKLITVETIEVRNLSTREAMKSVKNYEIGGNYYQEQGFVLDKTRGVIPFTFTKVDTVIIGEKTIYRKY